MSTNVIGGPSANAGSDRWKLRYKECPRRDIFHATFKKLSNSFPPQMCRRSSTKGQPNPAFSNSHQRWSSVQKLPLQKDWVKLFFRFLLLLSFTTPLHTPTTTTPSILESIVFTWKTCEAWRKVKGESCIRTLYPPPSDPCYLLPLHILCPLSTIHFPLCCQASVCLSRLNSCYFH